LHSVPTPQRWRRPLRADARRVDPTIGDEFPHRRETGQALRAAELLGQKLAQLTLPVLLPAVGPHR
jgi:hypothetical protein